MPGRAIKMSLEEKKQRKSEYDKQRRILKREELDAYQKEYRKTPGYRERQNIANKKYRANNKEKIAEYGKKRRASRPKSGRKPGRPKINRTPEEQKIYDRERNRRYREKHPEKRKETVRKNYIKSREQKSAYAKKYNSDPKNKQRLTDRSRRYEKSEKRKKYKKKYYADNFEHRSIIIKSYQNKRKEYLYKKALEWRKANKGKVAAAWAKSRAKRLKRIVNWSDESKIKEIYNNCPEGMHVDHIIPLLGKLISGLHIESNLQYLNGKENMIKNNKYNPRELNSIEIKSINDKIMHSKFGGG